jgi:hypothetical protein
MKHLYLAGAFTMASAFAALGAGPTINLEECGFLWSQANPGGAAFITWPQASPYVRDFIAADLDHRGTLDRNEFAQACESGLVSASLNTGEFSGAIRETIRPPTNRMDEAVPDMKSPK